MHSGLEGPPQRTGRSPALALACLFQLPGASAAAQTQTAFGYRRMEVALNGASVIRSVQTLCQKTEGMVGERFSAFQAHMAQDATHTPAAASDSWLRFLVSLQRTGQSWRGGTGQ